MTSPQLDLSTNYCPQDPRCTKNIFLSRIMSCSVLGWLITRYIIHIIYDILYCCVIFSYFLRNWCLSEKAIMAINTGFCTVLVAICFWKQVHLHRNDTAKVNYISLRLNLNKETNVEKFLSQSVQVDQTLIFHFNKQMINLIY